MPRSSSFSARKPLAGSNNQGQAEEEGSPLRHHIVAASGEFVGTFLFLFFAFLGHTMAANQASEQAFDGGPSSTTIIIICLTYPFSLLVNVWIFYRVTGAAFNPAVLLGLVACGAMPWLRGVIVFPAQILAGISAAAVASAIVPGDIAVTQTTLGTGVSVAQGFFLEMFLTSLLVLTIIMLAVEKSKSTYLAPLAIGLALFVAHVAGVAFTGASLNPARSFGPCVAARKFQSYHWIYWIGPFLGAVLAAGYYRFLVFVEWRKVNPGQDSGWGDLEGLFHVSRGTGEGRRGTGAGPSGGEGERQDV